LPLAARRCGCEECHEPHDTRSYEPFKLTPEGVGDKLSTSWTGEKQVTVTELDEVSKRFSIEVSGQFDMVNFWIHDRTLDMDGRVMNANRMFIAEDRQRSGFGRAFMQDAASLCDTVGIRKIASKRKVRALCMASLWFHF
jgi:hypothetical protein